MVGQRLPAGRQLPVGRRCKFFGAKCRLLPNELISRRKFSRSLGDEISRFEHKFSRVGREVTRTTRLPCCRDPDKSQGRQARMHCARLREMSMVAYLTFAHLVGRNEASAWAASTHPGHAVRPPAAPPPRLTWPLWCAYLQLRGLTRARLIIHQRRAAAPRPTCWK